MSQRPIAAPPAIPWAWVALGGVVVAAWAGLAATGGADMSMAGITLTISAAGAAAATGAAALAGATSLRQGWGLAAVLAGVLVLPVCLALAASGDEARPLIVVLPLVVALGVVGGGRTRAARLRAVGIAGIGTALLGAAILAGPSPTLVARTTTFGATIVIAAVLLVIAGAGGSVGVPALKPLLAVGALAGIIGAAAVPGIGVPLLVGAAAVGIAGIRPAVAVALFAIAVASLPGGQPAASLLAAAAVLAVALDREWGVVAALPGAIAMVEVLMFPGEIAPRVLIGATAALLGVQVARDVFPRPARDQHGEEGSRLAVPIELASVPGIIPRRAERHRLPVMVLAAWLLVAPGSWTWAGDAGITHYDTGAGRAVAVAALVLVTLAGADHRFGLRRLRMPA